MNKWLALAVVVCIVALVGIIVFMGGKKPANQSPNDVVVMVEKGVVRMEGENELTLQAGEIGNVTSDRLASKTFEAAKMGTDADNLLSSNI
ncbi:MAG: hypothetical protein AB1656_03855 [Candidatus Omnitrophota bacterium]